MSDELTWRQEIVREQLEHPQKERSRSYYYSDGMQRPTQMWVKHTPGANISMRVNKVYQPGLAGDDYSSSLQMNIGSEANAFKLYKALEAYFNDQRTPPWFLADVEMPDINTGDK